MVILTLNHSYTCVILIDFQEVGVPNPCSALTAYHHPMHQELPHSCDEGFFGCDMITLQL